MFAPIARRSAVRNAVFQTQERNVATLAELKTRIRSIASIGKLTKAMKMVAVAKLRVAQEQLTTARAFSAAIDAAWPEPAETPLNPSNATGHLFIPMASDRGLCGGVNNQVLRLVRPLLRVNPNKENVIIPIGDKGRTSLEREFAKLYIMSLADVTKVRRLTFKQVAMTSNEVLSIPFRRADVVYNDFVNSNSSVPTRAVILPYDIHVANTDIASKYENEGDAEMYANFSEFRTACRMFNFHAHSYASETAARMSAMSSSSKNANEMLQAISLAYNRQRQAKITSELSEIVSGAAAQEEADY